MLNDLVLSDAHDLRIIAYDTLNLNDVSEKKVANVGVSEEAAGRKARRKFQKHPSQELSLLQFCPAS